MSFNCYACSVTYEEPGNCARCGEMVVSSSVPSLVQPTTTTKRKTKNMKAAGIIALIIAAILGGNALYQSNQRLQHAGDSITEGFSHIDDQAYMNGYYRDLESEKDTINHLFLASGVFLVAGIALVSQGRKKPEDAKVVVMPQPAHRKYNRIFACLLLGILSLAAFAMVYEANREKKIGAQVSAQ